MHRLLVQVYMRAADGLRSECNIWSEALTSLMGSGPSSSSCLQVRMHACWACARASCVH